MRRWGAVAGSQQFRIVRAGVFASVSIGVSAAGHGAMSHHELPVEGTLTGFFLLFAVACAAAGKERGIGAICAWMLWGQLALHLLFSYVQSEGASHHGAAPQDVASDGGVNMFAAHVVAALISGWWLRQGEAALFSLLRLLGTLVLPVLVVVRGSGSHRPADVPRRPPDRGNGTRISRGLRHVIVLRGPPPLYG